MFEYFKENKKLKEEIAELETKLINTENQLYCANKDLKNLRNMIPDQEGFCFSSECEDCRFYEETRVGSGIVRIYTRCKLKNPVCKHFELAPSEVQT